MSFVYIGVSLNTLLDGQTDSFESNMVNVLADSMLDDAYEDGAMARLTPPPLVV